MHGLNVFPNTIVREGRPVGTNAGPWKPALRGIEERNSLVLANIGLVRMHAGNFFRASPHIKWIYSFEEAVSDGSLGLIRAAELYDESLGYAFGTYAGKWIFQAMQRGLLKSRLIRVPENKYKSKHKHAKIKAIPDTMISSMRSTGRRGHTSVLDRKALSKTCVPREVADIDGKRLLRRMVNSLPVQQREVMQQRCAGMTLVQIGEQMGCSRQYVQIVEKAALKKLRERFAKKGITYGDLCWEG